MWGPGPQAEAGSHGPPQLTHRRLRRGPPPRPARRRRALPHRQGRARARCAAWPVPPCARPTRRRGRKRKSRTKNVGTPCHDERRGAAGSRDRTRRAPSGDDGARRGSRARRGRQAHRGPPGGRRGGRQVPARRPRPSSARPPRATRSSPAAASIPRPSLPYLPFTEVVGQLVAGRPEQLTAHPELARLLPGHVSGEAVDRELGQLRVFDAMLSALDSLTAEAPALLVLEDLHWADRSSRDLLVFLLSRLTAQRLVVLATYRTDDLHRRHPLRPVLSELVRLPAVERLDLAPLGPGDTLDLVQRLANGSLSEELVRRAAERSEGNAFFAEELVSASSGGLPVGLAEVLMARIEGLPPATQQVLRLAAVAGRRVEHELLAAVSRAARRRAGAGPARCRHPPRAGGRRERCLRVPARAAARGDLHRAAARRAQQAARPLRQAASPSTAEESAAAELAHHAVAAHDLPLALAASVRAARRGRSPRRARRGAAARRARAGAVGCRARARAGLRHDRGPAHHAGRRGWRAPAAIPIGASRSAVARSISPSAASDHGAHGHALPPLRHAAAGAQRPRPGSP